MRSHHYFFTNGLGGMAPNISNSPGISTVKPTGIHGVSGLNKSNLGGGKLDLAKDNPSGPVTKKATTFTSNFNTTNETNFQDVETDKKNDTYSLITMILIVVIVVIVLIILIVFSVKLFRNNDCYDSSSVSNLSYINSNSPSRNYH